MTRKNQWVVFSTAKYVAVTPPPTLMSSCPISAPPGTAQAPPASVHEVFVMHNATASAHGVQVHYLEELGPSSQRLKCLNTTWKVNERKGLMDSLHDKT
jgi:hypothetical protein